MGTHISKGQLEPLLPRKPRGFTLDLHFVHSSRGHGASYTQCPTEEELGMRDELFHVTIARRSRTHSDYSTPREKDLPTLV